MTIRDIIISFGYEVNPEAEKKVNKSIDTLKSVASKALGSTGVSFEVDKESKKKAQDAISQIEDAASKLRDGAIAFDTDSKESVLESVKQLKDAISKLREEAIAFETDDPSKQAVLDNIAYLERAANRLEAKLDYAEDEASKKVVLDSIAQIASDAEKLRENIVGYDVDTASEGQAKESIEGLEAAAEPLAENKVGFEVDGASEREAQNRIRALRAFAVKALGVIGIGFSIAAIGRLSETFGSVNDQIRDATRGMGDQLEIQRQIKQAANYSRQTYEAMGDTISRLVDARAFGNMEDASKFATLMAQDFAASGKSQEQSAVLMRQISTSLQQGKVDARAMTIMFRESPHTINMIADSLGVTTDKLNDMARSG